MSLRNRIAGAGTNHARAAASYQAGHPAGTPGTPMTMPLSELHYAPDPGYPWGTLSYRTLQPRWSPGRRGGEYTVTAARDNGPFPALRAAGRP